MGGYDMKKYAASGKTEKDIFWAKTQPTSVDGTNKYIFW